MSSSRKNLIIIPGSCSDRLNWFDQINFFEKHTELQVAYLSLSAQNYSSFEDYSVDIERALESLLNDNTVVLAHSMGAMLLFKILTSTQNLQLKKTLLKIKIVLIQMPLQTKFVALMKKSLFLIEFISLFFKLFILWWLEPALYFAKNFFAFAYKNKNLQTINLFLNLLSMFSGFWKTDIKEMKNLIRFYANWQKHLLDFDLSEYENLFMTYGAFDLLCPMQDVKELGEKFPNLNLLKMFYGFHNPHHLFWYQKEFENLVLENLSNDTVTTVDV